MGAKKENPRYDVISFRVNKQEHDFLIKTAKRAELSLDEFVFYKIFGKLKNSGLESSGVQSIGVESA
ncbi:MAG TPA: hypothetical protein DCZ63_00580 [Geobacter sp.]|nr:hypothetical protein [Geobacter sp.]